MSVTTELRDMLDAYGIEVTLHRPMTKIELARENAKLREQIVQLQADWESERDYASQMEAKEKRAVAENAKLRKLARILYFCHQEGTECDECAMNGAEMSVKLDELAFCDGVNESMRELEIEVDG